MIQFSSTVSPSLETLNQAEAGWSRLLARKDLGFWQLPSRDTDWRAAHEFASELRKKGEKLTVIGLGGSALGARCLVESVGWASTVDFLFNSDPRTVEHYLADRERIQHSQFMIVSKSGNTLEVACLLDILMQRLHEEKRNLHDSVSVITEERSNPLFNWAKKHGLDIMAHPQDVGGRFSAFTNVGLVPAAFSGIEINEIRKGAQQALEDKDLVVNLAAFYKESFSRGETISVFWSYIDQLTAFLPWLIQLWAESLAKQKTRQGQRAPAVSTPIGYLGTCDQHSVLQQLMEGSKDKSICFLRSHELALSGPTLNGNTPEGFEYLHGKNLGAVFHTQSVSTEEALKEAGRTTLSLEIEKVNAATIARLMMVFELVIGVLGESLDINAFDQPGVELGKKITKEKLQNSSHL